MSRAQEQQILNKAETQNAQQLQNAQNSCAQAQGDVYNYAAELAKFAVAHPYVHTARCIAKYAGLTDDPKQRRQDHGNPSDWAVKTFSTEKEARNWEKAMHDSGYKGAGGGAGWKYGYTYTITSTTRE